MTGLGQQRESGLIVTEDWPGYISYREQYEPVAQEPVPAVVDVTKTVRDGVETRGCGLCSILGDPLVWLAIIIAIGGEALFSREKEPWQR